MRFEPFTLPPDVFRERLERLRFEFNKWDLFVHGRPTVEPGAIVLSPDEHAQLAKASEALAGVAERARHRIASEPESAKALGLPTDVARLAAVGSAGPVITRIDLFQTADGWKASEFNDDVPGGYNDAIGLPAVFHDVRPPGTDLPGDLPAALLRVLSDEEGPLGMVYATAYAEDLQVVHLIADLLRTQGIEVEFGSPAHVRESGGAVTLNGRTVSRLYRFFPAEWFPLLPNAASWHAHDSWDAAVVNPFASAWTQSKACFAWLHSNAAGHDRETVRDYLPHTWLLDDENATRALADRETYVLKPAFGRMGEGVSLGAALPADAWRKRVYEALRGRRTRPFVLQERFQPVGVDVGKPRNATVCLGAYVIQGQFAGYYARASLSPVTAYDATNVLPLVESL